MEKLADAVLSMEERQESTSKSIELIHILVRAIFLGETSFPGNLPFLFLVFFVFK